MQATQSTSSSTTDAGRRWWLIPGLLLLGIGVSAGAYLAKAPAHPAAHGAETPKNSETTGAQIHVDVVSPTRGTLERKTSQAGTAMAFEWVDIYAEVSGYLKTRTVDIGSFVKKGALLAEIDVPDLKAKQEQQKAARELAKAQVAQKKAAIASAEADLEAVKARKKAAEAKLHSDQAYLKFRDKQLVRFQDLFRERSIDARLVDEQEDRREAAFEAVNASQEAVHAAEAQLKSMEAKIAQAKADWEESQRMVEVAKAELDRASAMVEFSTMEAPFDGVITFRDQGFNEGAFIRAATGGGSSGPLLTLQHTDTMRIVVPIPDRDVPYCRPGVSEALITFDALPGEVFPPYPVSRIAQSEDLQTKTMRAEIDVPNPKGLIRQGMYGLVTITLAKAENAVSIPSACLAGKAAGGKATVYVVRDNKVYLTPIKTRLDNGIEIEVVQGLDKDARVVLNPSGDLADGVAVNVTEVDRSPKSVASAQH
jgi:RND family efflux transporter MFP subunit